jgi:hypothetical protein
MHRCILSHIQGDCNRFLENGKVTMA